MAAGSFKCTVITPERKVLETEASFVAFPAHDGEIGILSRRAPIVCRLGVGAMRVESDGKTDQIFIDGGFAQVNGNELSILTEQAKKPTEIDREKAQALMVEARSMPIGDDASFEKRQRAVKAAQVQLSLASKN